jgi:hypothetical protein
MPKYNGPEYAHCDRCPEPAGQLVKIHETAEETALCFGCWHPIKGTCKVIHWINRYGRIMYAPGATSGPFAIRHP